MYTPNVHNVHFPQQFLGVEKMQSSDGFRAVPALRLESAEAARPGCFAQIGDRAPIRPKNHSGMRRHKPEK
jgi:hypothetical protein